jgi:hypothetical protein
MTGTLTAENEVVVSLEAQLVALLGQTSRRLGRASSDGLAHPLRHLLVRHMALQATIAGPSCGKAARHPLQPRKNR